MNAFSSTPVPEVDARNGHIPAALFQQSQPIILRGLVAHWPAVQAACEKDPQPQDAIDAHQPLIKYLAGFATDEPLVVYAAAQPDEPRIGYHEDFSGVNFSRGAFSLAAFFQRLTAEPERTLYIGSSRVDRWLPGFRQHNDVNLAPHRPVINFWIGNQNCVAAHNDSPHNIACCVAGRRTFTLFPPQQVANLYLGPVDATPSGRPISLVDFAAPDFARFPRFAQAIQQSQQAQLHPGDALYIPPLWWHQVRSHAALNMLVNYWWRSTHTWQGVPDLALEHAMLTLRGMPASERRAWQAMFEHYVFSDSAQACEHIPEFIRGMLNPDDENAARLAWMNFAKKLNS